MATPIEQAAMRWYHARKTLQQAKDNLKAYRQKHGGCEFETEPEDRYTPGAQSAPCYIHTKDQNDWCETCRGSEPLYQARCKAGQEQGTAMRKLTRLCEKAAAESEAEVPHVH